MRNIKEVRWIESTLWRVGEREHTNPDLRSHQRPKARQTGLSLGLVFWPGVRHRRPRALASRLRWSRLRCRHFRRWGPGLQLLRPRPSTSAAAPGPPFVTARAARVLGLQPTLSSAIAKEEAAKTVGLRLPSMSTNYVFACVVWDSTTRPKRALGPLTTTRVPLEILGCWLIL